MICILQKGSITRATETFPLFGNRLSFRGGINKKKMVLFYFCSKGKVHKKKSKKKLTTVSFAFTHTYTLEKLTLLLFFPKRTWKILKNVQNAKEKNISLSHVICGSSPSFFVPFPYVILDIPILQTG